MLFFVWLAAVLMALVHPSPIFGVFTLLLPVIVVVQGSILYGWAGIACYLALGLAIGFGMEASSVANGFPFGSFTHNVAGLKPAGVAPTAIAAYAIIGWFSLMIGKLIALDLPWGRQPWGRITAPIVGAFVAAGLDLPLDPLGATIKKDWTFASPSGLYGVPLTNLLGWLLTSWAIFQIFVLIEDRFKPAEASQRRSFWTLPCLIWLAMSLQLPAGWLAATNATVASGTRTYVIADIHEGGIMVGLYSIIFMALLALNKIWLSGRKAFDAD